MASLTLPLLRGVLRFPGDDDAVVVANLRVLRATVVAEDVEAHILAFVGSLVDRTGSAPEFALVKQHYADLGVSGDRVAFGATIRLTEVETAGLPLPTVTEFAHHVDQFRETILTDHIGVLLQQATTIITTGLTPKPGPKNWKPQPLKGAAAALAYLQQGMNALSEQFQGGDIEGTLRDLSQTFSRYEARLGTVTEGVLTGYHEIDSVHNGIKPGELALLLGYTGQMKSTWLWNIIYHAAIWYGKNCVVYSMEMSAKALQDTFLVMHCQHRKFEAQFGAMLTITYDRLQKGLLTPKELDVVHAAIEDMATNPAYGQILYKEPESDQTVGQIKAWAEAKDQSVCQIDLLGIDYLALVNPTSGGQSMRESAIANLTMREAKQMAMTFRGGRGVAVVSPFQSNRKGYQEAIKASGRYELPALAWAPEAEKSADLVYSVFLNEQLRANNQLQVGNLKARDRRLIVDPITLMADPNLRLIEDFDPYNPRHQPVQLGVNA